jgi:hypothetical protein
MRPDRDEPRPSPPPILDYRTPPRWRPGLLERFWNAKGPDTFLGSCSLLFALLSILHGAIGWFMPGVACVAVTCAAVATLLALAGLCQPRANKMLPGVSLLLVIVSLLIILTGALQWA